METVRDLNGEELKVGDEVYFTLYKYHEIFKGQISRITKKSVYISNWSLPISIRKTNLRNRVIKVK